MPVEVTQDKVLTDPESLTCEYDVVSSLHTPNKYWATNIKLLQSEATDTDNSSWSHLLGQVRKANIDSDSKEVLIDFIHHLHSVQTENYERLHSQDDPTTDDSNDTDRGYPFPIFFDEQETASNSTFDLLLKDSSVD